MHTYRLRSRLPTMAIVLGCVILTGVASAAALNGLGSALLGSGTAPVAACDSDGFSLTHVLAGSTLTNVTVSGIHANCVGGTLSLTLTDATDAEVASGGPQAVPAGGSMTMAVSPNLDTSAFTNHHIRILGP